MDLISRQGVIEVLSQYPFEKVVNCISIIEEFPSAQPEQQNARIFQGIIVEYPTISTYPEHEGKPYFSIKYTENGQEFIGYGTYKPEVLSEYLKEYFMPSAQPTGASCWGCNCPKMERLKEQKTFSEMVHLHDAETHDKCTETHSCVYELKKAATDVMKRLNDRVLQTPSELLEMIQETHSCDCERTGTHESCTDCPLYDHDRHNCPRFNKVIPRTIEAAKPRWIPCEECEKRCEKWENSKT